MKAPYNRRQRGVIKFADGRKALNVQGRQLQTAQALVEAGPKGINAAEMSTWALRLGHYIFVLRNAGLEIVTNKVKFENGWYGQYVLITKVESIEVITSPQKANKTKPATAGTVLALSSKSFADSKEALNG